METTKELYSKIQSAVDEINGYFFGANNSKQDLPDIAMAVNNSMKSCVCAYVSADGLYNKDKDEKIQYLGINPRYLDKGVAFTLSTLTHELCHVYEHAYIHIPRGGYHDKQWAQLMMDCGLEPIYNNSSKTSVCEKPIENGKFTSFVKYFIEKYGEGYFNIVEYSLETQHKARVALGIDEATEADNNAEAETPRADNADKPVKHYNRNKIKYVCSGCGAKVWGKAGLHITCSDCNVEYTMEEKEDGE